MKKKEQSLTMGAAILLVSAIGVKIIGALFKIPLTNRIGGPGMGYYMTAYSVFNPIYAISVAGFPAAIVRATAIVTAKDNQISRDRIAKNAFAAFLPVGSVLSLILYGFSDFIAMLVSNSDSSPAIRAIAPAVFFCCLSSVLRGTFEGQRNMIPTAVGQLTEAMVKLCAGLSFVAFKVSRNPNASAVELSCAALWGVTLSTFAGFICLGLFYRPEKKKTKSKAFNRNLTDREIRQLLISAALPVCLAALVTNLTSLIDLATVMTRLSAAIEKDLDAVILSHPGANLWSVPKRELPNFLFGSYTALSMTVFHLIPALIAPLCTSALPMVSALRERGKRPETRFAVAAVLKAAAIFSVPAGMGIAVLSDPILTFLFPKNASETAVAAGILKPLGIASIFAAMAGPVNILLQAVGRPYVPARLMLQAAGIKLLTNVVFLSVPSVNIDAAAWGTLLCYAYITVRGINTLLRETASLTNPLKVFLRPVVGGGLCALTAYKCLFVFQGMMSEIMALPLSIACGGVVYAAFLLLFWPFSSEEADILLPKLKKS